MADEWHHWLARDSRFVVHRRYVDVRFGVPKRRRRRRHRVDIVPHEHGWELAAVAASGRDTAELAASDLWLRNRTMNVAQLVLGDGVVWVTGWVPYAGATAEESRLVLHAVAAEADRFEFLLTGRDHL